MKIVKAIDETGTPLKINTFSLEVFGMNKGNNLMQEIYCSKIEQFYRTAEYIKLQEEFEALCAEIENDLPESKKIMTKIDSLVVSKEVQLFDEGYRAGIADLITAMTFNELQITHAGVVDLKAIDKIRESKVETK